MFDISPRLNQPFRTFATAKNSRPIAQYSFKNKTSEELKKLDDILRTEGKKRGIDTDLDIYYQDEIKKMIKDLGLK